MSENLGIFILLVAIVLIAGSLMGICFNINNLSDSIEIMANESIRQTDSVVAVFNQRFIKEDSTNAVIRNILTTHGMFIRSSMAKIGYDTSRYIAPYDREDMEEVIEIEKKQDKEYEKLKKKWKKRKKTKR